jgi:hypothetical protein
MPDPIHPLHPAGVLKVHLTKTGDRGHAEEEHDRQQDERECDEPATEVGRLRDERERHNSARERGNKDRRPAHRLRGTEATRGQQAPVLSRQNLQLLRARANAERACACWSDRGRWAFGHAESGLGGSFMSPQLSGASWTNLQWIGEVSASS